MLFLTGDLALQLGAMASRLAIQVISRVCQGLLHFLQVALGDRESRTQLKNMSALVDHDN